MGLGPAALEIGVDLADAETQPLANSVRNQLASADHPVHTWSTSGVLSGPECSALDRPAEADVGVRLRCHERMFSRVGFL